MHIPTGGGKTHVAILSIDHYLDVEPLKKIMFLAPTRPLVNQLIGMVEKVSEKAARVEIACLVGQEMEGWTGSESKECVASN